MRNWLKHHFIPHHHNDHRPHILRLPAVRLMLVHLVVIELLFLGQAFLIIPSNQFAAILTSVLTTQTNTARESNQLATLTVNPLLEEAARQKAEDMASKGYFAHVAPDGTQPWKWLKGVGYYYTSAGENLAVNFTDTQDVTTAWLNSPGHRANILNGKFTEIGIGTAEGELQGKHTVFVVQFFGKPYKTEDVLARAATKAVAGVITGTSTKIAGATTRQPNTQVISVPTPTTSLPQIVSPTTSVPVPIIPQREIGGQLSTVVPNAPLTFDGQVLGTEANVLTGNVQNEKTDPSVFTMLIANPHQVSAFALGIVGLFMIIALALTFFIKIRMQHYDLLVNGMAIVCVAIFLILLNNYISVGDLLVT